MRLSICIAGAAMTFATAFLLPTSGFTASGSTLKDGLKLKLESLKASNNAVTQSIASFYQSTEFEPIWIDGSEANDKAFDLIEILTKADLDGLNREDYQPDLLWEALGLTDIESLVELELALSRTMIRYSRHLSSGRVQPHKVNKELKIFPKAPPAENILQAVALSGNLSLVARSMAPHTPRYFRLRKALSHYRDIAKRGGWTVTVDKGDTLKPDMIDPRVSQVRARLIELGDLEVGAHSGDIYDGVLVEAVKRFQARHGLSVDGVAGRNTLKEMNAPVEERIQQIKLNLERRRWMPDDLGKRYVFANLADQYLKVVHTIRNEEKTIHTALLQVGRPYHATPVFSQDMEYLEINPFWNVPKSIATKELLPKLKANPGSLQKSKIKVLTKGGSRVDPFSVDWASYDRGNFPFRLRQDPGGENSLGRIKFMFPNPYNIYIHDTPSKQNFDKASRFFSHGCLRVQNPVRLASALLSNQGWSRRRIENAIRAGDREVVTLERKIPVHITYLTAWVNKDGSVHFRRDIYNRDKRLARALNL